MTEQDRQNDLPGVIIPAYEPDAGLCELVDELLADGYPYIVVVDDGSSPQCRDVFGALAERARVHVVSHFVNLGKGDALKSGINHALVHLPPTIGVVTVDADGQHLAVDVLRVAHALRDHPDHLCLGVRAFGAGAPLRSRFGNFVSRILLRLVVGGNVSDTQIGLRAIPRAVAKDLLQVRAGRYEFELEMLIRALTWRIPIHQTPVATVYHDDNAGSHFDPIWDSLRVYFVFLRFLGSSLLTAMLDLILFTVATLSGQSLLQAVVIGRIGAGTFNFFVNKRIAFKASGSYGLQCVKYVTLVLALLVVSYQLMRGLTHSYGVNVYVAKIAVESFLFLASFSIQRMLVFTSSFGERPAAPPKRPGKRTDWDSYYQKPSGFASLTRRFTARRLIKCLRMYPGPLAEARILEMGGGGSCFFETIRKQIGPAAYEVLDSNRTGLELLRGRYRDTDRPAVHKGDVLSLGRRNWSVDICFSVGLIEHFDRDGTRAAVQSHFRAVRPGGFVILFFPTPTWLYRVTRALAERLGVWAFPDERPLPLEEVVAEVREHGRVKLTAVNWWAVLTQAIVVAEVVREPLPDSQLG